MKKTLTILTVLAVMLVAMMGSVSAASMSASNTKVNAGDTVTVTVTFDKAIRALEMDLTYDTSLFKYESASLGDLGGTPKDNGGTIHIAKFGQDGASTQTVTYTFKALTTAGTGSFAVNADTLVTDTNDTAPAATSVEVVVSTPDPEPDPEPEPEPDPDPDSEPGDKNIVGTDGKTVTELPKTGAPIFVGAIALIVVAGAVLVIRNRK